MTSSREILTAAAVIAVALLAQIVMAHPRIEYKEGVWVDEYYTSLIATDPSPEHALQALRAGMDGMPPLYFLLLRTAHRIVGGEAIPVYRGCSTVAMWIALLATYAALRSALNSLTAAVAVAAFWTHPLLARYAIEARPYSMMLAGLACVAWGLRLRGGRAVATVFLAAAFTSTIHYLGIVPLFLMLAAELILAPDSFAARLRRIAPGVLGMAALVPIVPLMLAQHHSLGTTWADPFSAYVAVALLSDLFFALPVIIVLLGWWLSRALDRGAPHLDAAALRRLAPLLAMLGLPAALLAYSSVGGSLMVDRYFIATLLGIPALLALALAETNGGLKVGLLILLLAASTEILRLNTSRLKFMQEGYDQIAHSVAGDSNMVIFESRGDALPLWFAHPELRARIAMLALPPAAQPALPRLLAYQQRVERNTNDLYDLPALWDAQTIARHGPFHFVGEAQFLPLIQNWMPMKLIDPRRELYEMTR